MRNLADPAVTTNLPAGYTIAPTNDGTTGFGKGGINAAGQIAISAMYQGRSRAVVLAPSP